MKPSRASEIPASTTISSARFAWPLISAMMNGGTSAMRSSDSRLGMVKLIASGAAQEHQAAPDPFDGVGPRQRVPRLAGVIALHQAAPRRQATGSGRGAAGRLDAGDLLAEAAQQPDEAAQRDAPP